MTTEITRRRTPEERELDKKRSALATLEAELTQHELDLATLQAELRAFEGQYLGTVGTRYAALDEIEAQIAEIQANLQPDDPDAQQRATAARAHAQESAESISDTSSEPRTFKPPETLKKLYRDLAKRVHPDLATEPEERERRTRLMAEVNAAYQAEDDELLNSLLLAWENSPEAVKGDTIGSELVRIIRKLAQVEDRLEMIVAEINDLKASELHRLRTFVLEAAAEGRDLLAAMAAQVDQQIAAARQRLDCLSAQRTDP